MNADLDFNSQPLKSKRGVLAGNGRKARIFATVPPGETQLVLKSLFMY